MFDTRLLDAATTLRFDRRAQHPLWAASSAARHSLRRFLRGHLAAAADNRAVHALWDGPQLRALLFHNRVETSWQGGPMQYVFGESALGDIDAEAWLLNELKRQRDAFDDTFELEVFGHQPRLRRGLLKLGLGIEALILAGEPVTALNHLNAQFGTRSLPEGLRFEVMTTQAQADAASDLGARLFAQNPEYCWFGARPDYVATERASLREKAAAADPLGLVLLDKRDRVVGYFGADLEPDDAHWGSVAGLLLTLCPSQQGQGIIICAYQRLLNELVTQGCRIFKGGTSQPAVMGLGRLMGRTLVSTTFRKRGFFPPEHFAAYLTP